MKKDSIQAIAAARSIRHLSVLIALMLLPLIFNFSASAQETVVPKAAVSQSTQSGDTHQSSADKQSSAESLTEELSIPKVIHIVGIPATPRNARGNLNFTEGELIFQRGSRQKLRVPYERIDRVHVLAGGREYAGEAIGAAMVTPFGLGGWLMALKQKVDVLIIEHHNEAGGSMGIVLQLPKGKGAACLEFLARFGIKVDQALAPAQPPAKQ